MAQQGLYLNNDGYTQISSKDFGNILSGNNSVARKFFVWNDKNRAVTLQGSIVQVGNSDMYNFIKWAWCPNTLGCPSGIVLSLVAGGALVVDTTYYYKITALNATGQTTGSIEKSIIPTAGNQSIKLDWNTVTGATQYKIYRSVVQGSYTDAYIDTVNAPTVTYTDVGVTTSAPSIPIENTTAGAAPNYGIAPTLAAGTLSVTLLAGEQKAFWGRVDIPDGTTETGNPRSCNINFAEV